MSSQVLELEKVTKRFGDFIAVDDVSRSIPRGSIYGFLGQNGAGKTTTIRMIFDILKPTSGRISILGASSALDVRHRIGYLPEEKGLYKAMTAAATIAYFASLKGLSRKAAKQRARELLERYGLGEFADSRIQALSKGMGQKVQVICARSRTSPSSSSSTNPFGLDPVNQQVLEKLIRDLAGRGSTVLFSTHVMQHAGAALRPTPSHREGPQDFRRHGRRREDTIPPRATAPKAASSRSPGSTTSPRSKRLLRTIGTSGTNAKSGAKTSAQTILERCFKTGIVLRRFNHSEPSLHDALRRARWSACHPGNPHEIHTSDRAARIRRERPAKGIWIGIFTLPVILAISIGVSTKLAKSEPSRHFVVVDNPARSRTDRPVHRVGASALRAPGVGAVRPGKPARRASVPAQPGYLPGGRRCLHRGRRQGRLSGTSSGPRREKARSWFVKPARQFAARRAAERHRPRREQRGDSRRGSSPICSANGASPLRWRHGSVPLRGTGGRP